MIIQYVPFSDRFAGGTLRGEVYFTQIRNKGEGSENIFKTVVAEPNLINICAHDFV